MRAELDKGMMCVIKMILLCLTHTVNLLTGEKFIVMAFEENPLCQISFLKEWLGQEFRGHLRRPDHIKDKPLKNLNAFFEEHTKKRNLELLNLPKVEVDISWKVVSYVNIKAPVPHPQQ